MRARSLLLALCMLLPAAAHAQDDAYGDATARELVRLARERRLLTDTRIREYHTTATERISIGLDAGLLEKLAYRRETASRIHWTRDTVRIDILGAREVVPLVARGVQVPSGLAGSMPALAFDPVQSEMLLRLDSTSIRHPLAQGSEAHYRFTAGDSTVIALPDGRQVRLRELRFQPRRAERELITGSFWLDRETHAVVQAYFRLARHWSSADENERIPFVGELRAELDYIAIEYGLWDLRWWLPRTVAARGVASAGRFRLPVEFTRSYRDYDVVGDTTAPVPQPGAVAALDSLPCRPRTRFTIAVSTAAVADPDATADSALARARRGQALARDSAAARLQADSAGAPPDSAAAPFRTAAEHAEGWRAQGCDRVFLVQRAEGARLLDGDALPGSIWADDSPATTPAELEAIARRVRDLPVPPATWQRPRLQLPWLDGDLLRYNRVEGASIGARVVAGAGPFTLSAEARLATAPMEPYGALGLRRDGLVLSTEMRAYRQVAAMDLQNQPFGFTSTAAALLLGRDDNHYFRATGAELNVAPARTRTQWYALRLYAETQRRLARETDFSVLHKLGGDDDFLPNAPAARADQAGAALRLRSSFGPGIGGVFVGAEVELLGETGDYTFGRGVATVRATAPLGRLALGVEGSAGAATEEVTLQRQWFVGGVQSLRGYAAGAAHGRAFWRGRLELGTGMPLVRLTAFGDVGWAGEPEDATKGKPLRAAGIGIGALDGLIRLDLARALDRHRGWRLHLQMDGVL